MHASRPVQTPETFLRVELGEFWSGDLGLTLLTISLVVLVFVVTPLREVVLPARAGIDLIIFALMLFGVVAVKQNRTGTIFGIAFISLAAVILFLARSRRRRDYANLAVYSRRSHCCCMPASS